MGVIKLDSIRYIWMLLLPLFIRRREIKRFLFFLSNGHGKSFQYPIARHSIDFETYSVPEFRGVPSSAWLDLHFLCLSLLFLTAPDGYYVSLISSTESFHNRRWHWLLSKDKGKDSRASEVVHCIVGNIYTRRNYGTEFNHHSRQENAHFSSVFFQFFFLNRNHISNR